MKKITAILVFALAAIFAVSAVAPAFAKDYNLDDGVSRSYLSEGSAIIATPAGWPSGGIPANNLRIEVHTIESGSLISGDLLSIQVLYPQADGSLVWVPIAVMTTNPDALPFLKTLMSGLPPTLFPLNLKSISDTVFSVERHGNSISAELTTQQTILWLTPTGSVTPVKVPAFTMSLDKVGGSVHQETTTMFAGYPGASGYTKYVDEMGFNANGAFTCVSWGYASHPMTDGFVAMHAITTYVPPS
jgi:hypothetical protein